MEPPVPLTGPGGYGNKRATTVCTAAATFGLIAGSVIGGPIGKGLIEKYDLLKTIVPEDDSLLIEEEELLIEEEKKHERHTTMYAPAAVFQLIIAIESATLCQTFCLYRIQPFPIYIGAMISAAVIRNIGEYKSGKIQNSIWARSMTLAVSACPCFGNRHDHH